MLHFLSALISFLLIPVWTFIVYQIVQEFRQGEFSTARMVTAVLVLNVCIILAVLSWLTSLNSPVTAPHQIVWAIAACLLITMIAAPLVGRSATD